MRKFTSVFFTLLAAGLLAFGGAGCSAKAKAARHLKQADHFFDAGEFDKAEIEYDNVLHNDPRNSRAIGQLGKIYFDQGSMNRAAPYLFAASQWETNDFELRLKLGMVYVAAGKFKEARNEANFILDRKPQDAGAPLLLAEAADSEKEIAAARSHLQKLSQSGDTAAIETALGTLAFRGNDFKTADEDFRRAQNLDPKFSTAYSAAGALYWAQNDLKQAEAAFKTAAELSPVRSPDRIQYVQFQMQTGKLAEAKSALEEVVKKTPDYLPAWIGLAKISLLKKNFDDCAASLSRVLARDAGNYDALLLSGQLDLTRGESAKAVAELEKMAGIYPQSPRVHYELALACLANDETDNGVNNLNQALSLDPNFAEAALMLAKVKIKSGDTDSAVAALKQLIQRQPQMTQASLELAGTYRIQGNFDGALEIYRQLEKLFPQDPQIPLLAGSIFVQQKNNEQARVEFNRALEISTNTLPALQQLVNLDLTEKKFTDAIQLVQTEIEKNPAQAELRLILAQIYLAQGDKIQAKATLKKVTELSPEGDTAYLLLGQLCAELKQNDQALANLKLAAQKNPKSVAALMALGVFQNDAKNYNAAADAYEKLLAINPGFGPALNNLAYLYSENLNQLDRAYDLAQKARGLYPDEPSTADTLGWILCKKGQYQSALSLLQESAGKLPDEPEIQFHLGMVNYMMGHEDAARARFQRALDFHKDFPTKDECNLCLSLLAIDPKTAGSVERAILEKRMAERPDDPVALARLGAIYQLNGESDKAIGLYESALKANPKNVKAMMVLIGLYAPTDRSKAFDLAQTAYKLSPDEPGISHVYGRLAFQTGNYKLSFGLLQDTVQNQPGDSTVLYDFALAAYSLGKVSDAAAAMQNALQAGLPPAQSNQASLFLDMISLASNPAQAATTGARVAGILKTNADYVPALMARAVINGQNASIAGAQQDYEKILSDYPDFAPAQRGLAILYAEDPGKTGRAYELAMKARDDFPNDPALTKALGIIVFQQGDYSRAANLLKSIADERNNDAEFFYYLGLAQYHLKNGAESKMSLQQALTLNLSGDQAAEARRILAELK
jgi:tetratricopeptide (TPR) repeat protein